MDLQTGGGFFRSRRNMGEDRINIICLISLRLEQMYGNESKQSQGEDSDRVDCLDKQDEWR